jgi:toxin ParE1/3/4
MKVRYTATARADVDEILDRIRQDNPSAAMAVAGAIKAAAARLRWFPRIGAETDEPGIYMKIVRPYRYLIFYRITSDRVVIRNVRLPARRQPPSHRS